MNEAGIFYGRNSQKDDVLARLLKSRMVFVLGSSGCGKSSLIKAGVIPALKAGLLTNEGHYWQVVTMRPGRRSVESLAEAFSRTLEGQQGAPRHSEVEVRGEFDRRYDEAQRSRGRDRRRRVSDVPILF
jgi:energy-coupling factor transporter ATP-binding protein EcfA2